MSDQQLGMIPASVPPPAAFAPGVETNGNNNDPEKAVDDEVVHDLLPSVEEIRMQHAMAGGGSGGTKRGMGERINWCYVWFLIGVAVVIGASVGLGVGISRAKNNANPPPSDKLEDFQEYIVAQSISLHDDVVKNSRSPQYKAAKWMADDDSLNLVVPTDNASREKFVQRYVLALLYYALDGDNWDYNLGFLTARETCNWQQTFINSAFRTFDIGAVCGGNNVVETLHIPGNELRGSLPSEIAHLTALRFLALNTNSISGELPFQMQRLSQLDYMAFQYNQLTGTLPRWLGSMTVLRVLGFGNNAFEGSIPSEWASLTGLVTLGLDDNDLSGDLSALSNMALMERLYLEDNSFRDSLSATSLGQMQMLRELDLSANEIVGQIPRNLFNKPSLLVMDLHANLLTGELPVDIPANNMTYLALQQNSLGGSVPFEVSRMTALTHVDLSSNQFTSLPEEFYKLTALQYLFVGSNNFAPDGLPFWLENLVNLVDLSFKETNRTGNIPDFLGNMQNLKLLDLDKNRFSGTVPEFLSTLTDLQFLILNRNNLNGPVPASVQSLPSLELVAFDRNSITGNLDGFCKPDGQPRPRILTADCDQNLETTCSCCTTCCNDNNDQCEDNVFLGTLDPIWENSYERRFYKFADSIIFDSTRL